MFKFKREDLGLYVTTSLLGCGVGILIGGWLERALENARIDVEDEERVTPVSEDLDEGDFDEWGNRIVSLEDQNRLYALIEAYPGKVTSARQEMIWTGTLSIDELHQILLDETEAEENDVVKERVSYNDFDKPDISEVVAGLEDDDFEQDHHYEESDIQLMYTYPTDEKVRRKVQLAINLETTELKMPWRSTQPSSAIDRAMEELGDEQIAEAAIMLDEGSAVVYALIVSAGTLYEFTADNLGDPPPVRKPRKKKVKGDNER